MTLDSSMFFLMIALWRACDRFKWSKRKAFAITGILSLIFRSVVVIALNHNGLLQNDEYQPYYDCNTLSSLYRHCFAYVYGETFNKVDVQRYKLFNRPVIIQKRKKMQQQTEILVYLLAMSVVALLTYSNSYVKLKRPEHLLLAELLCKPLHYMCCLLAIAVFLQ